MIDYEVKFQNRKTLTIKVRNRRVFVFAPYGTSHEYVDSFVIKKADWINKAIAKQTADHNELGKITDNETLLFGEAITLPSNFATDRKGFYLSHATYLENRIRELANVYGYDFSTVKYSVARTSWGRCNSKKQITLNLALLAVPKRLSDYVIAHELTHTKHFDHSKAFYAALSKVMPDHAKRRKELKNHEYVLGLFYGK